MMKYFLTIHIKACNNSYEIVFLFLIFDSRTNVFNLILLIAFIKINDRPINKKNTPTTLEGLLPYLSQSCISSGYD